jgi:hypothetical protein
VTRRQTGWVFLVALLAGCQPVLELNSARFFGASLTMPASVVTDFDDRMRLSVGSCSDILTFHSADWQFASCASCAQNNPIGSGWLSSSKGKLKLVGSVLTRVAGKIETFDAELSTESSTASELSGTITFTNQNGQDRALEFRAARIAFPFHSNNAADAQSQCESLSTGLLNRSNCCQGAARNSLDWPKCVFEDVCRQ